MKTIEMGSSRVVTSDSYDGVCDPVDVAFMADAAAGRGVVVDEEMLRALGEAARKTRDLFVAEIRSRMTLDRARKVFELRVREEHSWRALARALHDEFERSWDPPSNQIAGLVLCEEAQRVTTGEDWGEAGNSLSL